MKIINKHSNAVITITVIYAIIGFVGALAMGAIFKDNPFMFLYCVAAIWVSLIPLFVAYHIVSVVEDTMYRNYLAMEEMYKLLKQTIDDGSKEEESETDNHG